MQWYRHQQWYKRYPADMIWYDMIWYCIDMIWYDIVLVWYPAVLIWNRIAMKWNDIAPMIWNRTAINNIQDSMK